MVATCEEAMYWKRSSGFSLVGGMTRRLRCMPEEEEKGDRLHGNGGGECRTSGF